MTRPALFTGCLTAVMLAGAAGATDLTTMSDAEREAFRAEVRAYLIENPEVLVEAFNTLEQRQAAEQAKGDAALVADNADAIFDDGTSWVGGNPDGDITLVEFVDYRCGYCRKAHDEVAELIKSDGNIRFIVKEFPILGEQSVHSARFALAVRQAAGDEVYKKAHDALITLKGDVNATSLTRLAGDLGLDAQDILARMESPEVSAVIAANHELAGRMQISGTPTFVLGGQMVRGYVPLAGMREIVAEERG
ncbi:MAG: DsbA family protein [Paracoccaceae bacterium]